MKFLISFFQGHCEQLCRLYLLKDASPEGRVDGNPASAQIPGPAPSQGLQPDRKQCLLLIYALRLDIISYVLERL